MKLSRGTALVPVAAGLLLFRIGFGLCSEFWFSDELQVYLLGLKFYTTGHWPLFGPDVVYTRSQIPGALQGLLVGIPLYVRPVPEAPCILLNLLSFSALCLFAWYTGRRIGTLPRWFIWAWLLSAPWTLNLSTHVVNPSYVLAFSILFFIGLFEALPLFPRPLVPRSTCFFTMGLSLICILQLHMSWILLVPFAGIALYYSLRRRDPSPWREALCFLAGILAAGSLLVPTLLHAGSLGGGTGGTTRNIVFNANHIRELPTILIRFLSFASFEFTRFAGAGTRGRIEFFRTHWWVVPFAACAISVGFIQPLYFIVSFFRRSPDRSRRALKRLCLAAVLLTWCAFLFSVKGPSSHTFYVLLPLAMFYSFHCYRPLLNRRPWRIAALVLIVSGLLCHVALALHRVPRRSLYADRDLAVTALRERNYRILGLRRSDEWGCCY